MSEHLLRELLAAEFDRQAMPLLRHAAGVMVLSSLAMAAAGVIVAYLVARATCDKRGR